LIGKSAYVCVDSPLYVVARKKDGTLTNGPAFRLFAPQNQMKIAEAVVNDETPTAYGMLLLLKSSDVASPFVLALTLKKSDSSLRGEALRKALLGEFAVPRFAGLDLEVARYGQIRSGMDADSVRCAKGAPDQMITSLNGNAWVYEKQHTTVYFFDGKVHDIVQTDGF
jgi:hypothetical protein